jgi:hypothetical protein
MGSLVRGASAHAEARRSGRAQIRAVLLLPLPPLRVGIPNAVGEQPIHIGKVGIAVDEEVQAFTIVPATCQSTPAVRDHRRGSAHSRAPTNRNADSIQRRNRRGDASPAAAPQSGLGLLCLPMLVPNLLSVHPRPRVSIPGKVHCRKCCRALQTAEKLLTPNFG